ncbi:hypothetical protein Peur_001160 [Populus x canadensis]
MGPVSAPITLRAETRPTSNEYGFGHSSPPPSAPPPQGLLQGRGATQVIWARPQLLSGYFTITGNCKYKSLFQSLHQPAN